MSRDGRLPREAGFADRNVFWVLYQRQENQCSTTDGCRLISWSFSFARKTQAPVTALWPLSLHKDGILASRQWARVQTLEPDGH